MNFHLNKEIASMYTEKQEERIVTVDENDNVTGEEYKGKCHDGGGILHRGFLAMVLNNAGELLLTRRSDKKRLWPGFWDGSVASHVLRGEDYELASIRRLREEIGLATEQVRYAFKFQYKVGYNGVGTEHEICAVTIVHGIEADALSYDRDEISEARFVEPDALMKDIKRNGRLYTPWLILAMEHMEGSLGGY
jgi:isopentenyl-diphosphate delta-isomerase